MRGREGSEGEGAVSTETMMMKLKHKLTDIVLSQ